MTFSEEKVNGVIDLRISGKMNSESSGGLLEKMTELIDKGPRQLLLDLSRVDYINSSGQRILLTAARKMTDLNGRIVLAHVTELIDQVLQVSGFASHVEVYPAREEVLKALKA